MTIEEGDWVLLKSGETAFVADVLEKDFEFIVEVRQNTYMETGGVIIPNIEVEEVNISDIEKKLDKQPA